jgi:hypothetical protein
MQSMYDTWIDRVVPSRERPELQTPNDDRLLREFGYMSLIISEAHVQTLSNDKSRDGVYRFESMITLCVPKISFALVPFNHAIKI